MTPGIPPYVRDTADIELLTSLHRAYLDVTERAYELVCARASGIALVPHTYGPRSLGIDAIDDQIVDKLRWACAPERETTWPLRAEVDLLTRDADGVELSPPGAEASLLEAFRAAGLTPVANGTYFLHESSLGHRWSAAYPGRVLSLEVRRDLLVERWDPFAPMHTTPAQVARIVDALAPTLIRLLRAREPGSRR